MSRVPEYGGRKVQSNALPGGQLAGRQVAPDAGTFGAGVGGAVQQAGLQINQELLAHQQDEALRQDQARVVDARKQMSDWELQNIYSQNGALAQTGKNALGLPDTVSKSFEETVGQVRDSLANDRQKAAFDQSIVSQRESVLRTVNQHVVAQARVVEKEGNDGFLANSYQLAVQNAGNPERIATELDNSSVQAALYAQTQGMDGDATRKYVDNVRSNIHVGVLDQLLATGQDVKAKSYFDAAKDEISAVDLPKVERALDIGTTQGESQRLTRKIVNGWQSAPDSTSDNSDGVTITAGREKTLQEALDEADSIADPKMQDSVKDRIRASYSDYKRTQSDAQQQNALYVKSVIDKAAADEKAGKEAQAARIANGIIANHVTSGQVFDFIDAIAPGRRAVMQPEELAMWKNYSKQMAEKGAITTNTGLYYALLQEGATDPEKFKAENLTRFSDQLEDGLLRGMMKDQTDMIRGEGKESDRFKSYRSTEQIVEAAMSARGMLIAPTKKVDSPAWSEKMRAMALLDQRVADVQESNQKPVTDDEKQQLMDQLIIGKKVPGWFSDTVPTFIQDASQLPRGFGIGDVPLQEQRTIRTQWRQRWNSSPTDAEVATVYLEHHAATSSGTGAKRSVR